MKIFAISDVHSFYDEMIEALKEAGFDKDNENHMLISCGDMFDRGPNSGKCLNFLMSLNKDRVKFIHGNHEELLQDVIRKGYFERHDVHNGTDKTVYQLSGIYPSRDCDNYAEVDRCAIFELKCNELLQEYFDRCIDYYEIGDYIFVHGWIPTTYPKEEVDKYGIYCSSLLTPIYDESWRDSLMWSEARWLNGMEMWRNDVLEPGKTIVCGHWHSAWGNANIHGDDVKTDEYNKSYVDEDYIKNHSYPFKDKGIVALDACTVASGKVNCVVFEVEN